MKMLYKVNSYLSFSFLLVLSTTFLSSNFTFAELLPQDIVKKADLVRFPEGSYSMNIIIISKKSNKDDEIRGYEVLVKDTDRVLVKFTSPKSEIGKSLLTLDEDIWIYLPDAGRPVRIPPQQRLIGDVSVGDIARANFSEDYYAKLVETENINRNSYYALELKAKNDKVTYQMIKYWVQRENFHPIKAEFYTESGRLIKTAFYEDYGEVLGDLRPKKLRIIHGSRDDHISILEYKEMYFEELSMKIFNKNYMIKLE